MKLVSLNLWGGRLFEPLMGFVDKVSDADVFCFQEVFHNDEGIRNQEDNYHPDLFNELRDCLPGHKGMFDLYEVGHSYEKPVDYRLKFGLASFVNNSLPVTDHGSTWVSHKDDGNAFLDRNLQYFTLEKKNREISFGNLHGIWIEGAGKVDRPERIEQSEKVNRQMSKLSPTQVLCGDFNLDPDTESLALLESERRNLIKEYDITSTRTTFYEKPGKYADYTLVSPGISVIDFQVPDEPVSDHRPMILDFDLD